MNHRLILMPLACALAATLKAQPRSEREMQAIAANHLYGAQARGHRSQQLQQILTTPMVAAYADRTAGTVFVSRDAIFAPVLGWTDRPLTEADALPDGLRWWIATITATLTQKVADNTLTTIRRTPAAPDVQPLVTSRWAQDTPYNDKCPVADSWSKRRAQTGCVATAMAQIMNYHEYPAKGQGTGYYTLNGSKKNVRIDATYDWPNMKDTYSGSGQKDETTDAVSTLMYDCGLASGMDYALQGSGATTVNAAIGMVNHFSYDEAAMHCSFRVYANDEAWLAQLYAELQAGRPVLYASTDATYGAHAFVIDGCRADDGYVHVNWGWSGDADGWFDFFNLSPQTTYQQAYGMAGYDFSQDVQSQSMLTGITAPGAASFDYEAYWCMDAEERITVEGDSITLHLPTLINYHFQEFRGLVGLCIQDVETGHSPIQPFYYTAYGESPVKSLSGWQAQEIPYFKSVTDELTDGDYDLFLMAWHEKAIGKTMPQYVRFPARNDGRENYNVWRMTKHDGHLTIQKQDVPVESGISAIENGQLPIDDAVYDLQGRRILNSQSSIINSKIPHHGIYIKNGKKYIR